MTRPFSILSQAIQYLGRDCRLEPSRRIQEQTRMSGVNGDKARFHKKRKSKIARRIRNHAEVQKAGGIAPASEQPSKGQAKQ